jgi:hypothetical protein
MVPCWWMPRPYRHRSNPLQVLYLDMVHEVSFKITSKVWCTPDLLNLPIPREVMTRSMWAFRSPLVCLHLSIYKSLIFTIGLDDWSPKPLCLDESLQNSNIYSSVISERFDVRQIYLVSPSLREVMTRSMWASRSPLICLHVSINHWFSLLVLITSKF